jgi:parvulin-like peptidyl-prolyl isomerase
MKWHRLAASAVVVGFLAGCQAEHPALAGDPIPTPDLRLASPATPVRSQKPDIRQTVFEAVNSPFPALKNGEVTVSVRAHVNGVPIFDDEVKEICYPALISLPPSLSETERAAKQAQIFREGLQQIIDREIILQDAFTRLSKVGGPYVEKLKTAASKEFDKTLRTMRTRSGAKSDDDFKEMLRAQGQTVDGVRRQFERNFMAREYMRSRIYPIVERATGHQQIQEYYQEHPGEFQAVDSVQWQDIFIDAGRYRTRAEARTFAEQLIARARKGEDFAKLMKYDNGDSTYRNGEGFGRRHGEIKPIQAEPLLFQMKDGEVGPVIEISTGFHVIRLVKRTHAGLMPLDEKLQNEIRRKLQNLVVERESKKFLEELKQKATVEIDRHPSGQ